MPETQSTGKHLLLTAGYSGFNQETFWEKLQGHGVEVLVDVRDNPFSRNRDFTQSPLKAFLATKGVEYLHYRPLGVPAPLRRELKASGDLAQYFAAYRSHLAGQRAALASLCELATRKTCCLLCLERNPHKCHRSVLAEVLTKLDGHQIEVRHL